MDEQESTRRIAPTHRPQQHEAMDNSRPDDPAGLSDDELLARVEAVQLMLESLADAAGRSTP